MKRFLTGAALLAGFALAGHAAAVPGQCEVTGYDGFSCDVTVDGGGFTFALPDGQIFAFALVAEGVGQGYLIAAEASPGQLPVELGSFAPVENEPGCWYGEDAELKVCAMVVQ